MAEKSSMSVRAGGTVAQIVLDSWAVLAWLQGEPAGQPVINLVRWLSGEAEAQGKLTALLERIGEADRGKVQLALNLINLGEISYTSPDFMISVA